MTSDELPNDTDSGVGFYASYQRDGGPFEDAAIFKFVGENGAYVSADSTVDHKTTLAPNGALKVSW